MQVIVVGAMGLLLSAAQFSLWFS